MPVHGGRQLVNVMDVIKCYHYPVKRQWCNPSHLERFNLPVSLLITGDLPEANRVVRQCEGLVVRHRRVQLRVQDLERQLLLLRIRMQTWGRAPATHAVWSVWLASGKVSTQHAQTQTTAALLRGQVQVLDYHVCKQACCELEPPLLPF